MRLANTTQIREADRLQIEERQVPGILLMEQAGQQAALVISQQFPDQQSFLILAGPGNNGGDGLVIARYLYLAGKDVQVLLSHPPERYLGDALLNYHIIGELPIPLLLWSEEDIAEIVDSFSTPPLLIDALLGTGIQESLRDPILSILNQLRPLNLPVVAIDLPSGLSADTGELINPPLPTHTTLTFQLPKICHAVSPAAQACGKVVVLDIGIWPEVIDQLGIQREWLTKGWLAQQVIPRPLDGHKGSFGHALLIGGSRDMSGAIALSGMAAVRGGAGLVSVFTPMSCRQTVLQHVPEAMCLGMGDQMRSFLQAKDLPQLEEALVGKRVVAIGPGIGTREETADLIEGLLPRIQVPLVLDADALNLLSERPEWWNMLPESTILTPHPGEMRRLMDFPTLTQRRLEAAERLAQDRNVIVVLKGAATIIALPDGRSFVNSTGNPGMASGGTGDVLTGFLAALLAQGYELGIAAAMAVFLHGQAGDQAAAALGQASVTAREVIRQFRLG